MRDATALVLIEFQREWLDRAGKLGSLLQDEEQLHLALQGAARAVEAARAEGIPVVHAGLRFQPGYIELGAAAHGLRGAIPRAGTWLGEWSDFVEPFAPREGEFVVAGRVGASAFTGSNLDAYLRHNRIEHIYVAGFALHVCVLATLCQGHDLGYDVAVLEDACAAFNRRQRQMVLDDVVHHFGERVTGADFITRIATDVGPTGVVDGDTQAEVISHPGITQ
jgi:biuret amidohydrolase